MTSQHRHRRLQHLQRLCLAVCSLSTPAWAAAATCQIGASEFFSSSFVLRDVAVNHAGPGTLNNFGLELTFNKPVQASRIWGSAGSLRQASPNVITIAPTPTTLAANATLTFGLRGDNGGGASSVSCRVVGGSTAPAPSPAPSPSPAPAPSPAPQPSGEKCERSNPAYLFSQHFESFSPGQPLLGDEKSFKNQFCIPLRYISGFGNDAEPPLSELSGKKLADRLAREAAGQYNGASNTVRVALDNDRANAWRGNSLKVLYPQGTNTSSHSGTQFEMVIPGVPRYDSKSKTVLPGVAHNELFINYKVKFETNFDFAFGGKLPGLLANYSAGDPNGDDEVSARLMWRENGRLEFYLHTPHDPRERLLWNNVAGAGHATVERGKWHNIQIRMKLNAPGKANGVWQGWLDGKLVADYRDLRFRNADRVSIHSVFFSTFHGGSSGNAGPGEIWWPNRDVQAWFDDFDVSTRPIPQ